MNRQFKIINAASLQPMANYILSRPARTKSYLIGKSDVARGKFAFHVAQRSHKGKRGWSANYFLKGTSAAAHNGQEEETAQSA
jgi:hypothetical protein